MDDIVEIETAQETPQIEVVEQPLQVRLRYGTDLHKEIVERLNARRELSAKHIETRYDNWDRVDEHVRCFIDLTRKAKKADGSTDNNLYEMPFQYAIVVPASYTILMTRLTALMAIFTNRLPWVQIEGVGPEDVLPARGMEAMLNYDLRQMRGYLTLYALNQDAEKYGLGATYDTFETEMGWTYKPNPFAQSPMARVAELMGVPLGPLREYGVAKEYNLWSAIDPFNFWPDPRVPLSCIKQMEFIGHSVNRAILHFLENRIEKGGPYINVEFIKQELARKGRGEDTRRNTNRSRSRNNLNDFSLPDTTIESDRGFYTLDQMQVRLIPREWKLGDGDDPERWQFGWLDEELLVRANPLPFDHGQFTYSITEPNYDPHVLFNPGVIENMDGMQRMMNWFYNSHLENVRRMVNNASVYGPSFINEKDILDPGPAGHVRLTDMGEALINRGYSIESFFHQAQISDLTRGHITDMELMFELLMRMSQTNDISMGQPTESKRTLGEIQRLVLSHQQGVGRVARLTDEMALQPWVERAIANRQQFTTLSQYFQVVGEAAKKLGDPRVLLNRMAILGNFNYSPNTGVIPPEPERFAEVWERALLTASKIPQLFTPGIDGKILNIREPFNEFVRAAGIKDFDRFYIPAPPVRVVSDEEAAKGAKAGNFVPAPAIMDPVRMARGGANGS